jgi:hypothetical protein
LGLEELGLFSKAIPSAAAAVCDQKSFVTKQTYNENFSHAFFSVNNTAYFMRPPFFDLCEWAVKAPTVMIS